MSVLTETVREIALNNPASIRVFEEFGIDYCCGGRKPLDEACAAKNIKLETVLAALDRAAQAEQPKADDWTTRPLAVLAAHIVSTHHAYVSRETPRLAQLAARVVNRHGNDKPELLTIQEKLAQLSEELTEHCAKEEVVLFPYIQKLEKAVNTGSAKPHGCFGSVTHPIAMMTQEHDHAGALMAEIRELSNNYTPPPGACPTFLAYYSGLLEYEQDLHQHVHLENNILFPRAIAMESASA